MIPTLELLVEAERLEHLIEATEREMDRLSPIGSELSVGDLSGLWQENQRLAAKSMTARNAERLLGGSARVISDLGALIQSKFPREQVEAAARLADRERRQVAAP